ncbi:helix-turn-helix domain-containing protein [Virgibacillus dokdonensis]|uniref:helix-turn-helix domain-containing protein n=1 Tax=Virgibacillus dokdonensis TaxID=302167 RepID=UPI00098B29C7|nr:helix-turn-helix transcriptional regulator [Virgibacillus dokdonensis]
MKIIVKDSEELRAILIEEGYSQREFSRLTGLSENYFNQIINHKKNPSPAVAKKISQQLGLEFNDVFQIKK